MAGAAIVDLTISDDEGTTARTPKHRNHVLSERAPPNRGDGSQNSPMYVDDLPRPHFQDAARGDRPSNIRQPSTQTQQANLPSAITQHASQTSRGPHATTSSAAAKPNKEHTQPATSSQMSIQPPKAVRSHISAQISPSRRKQPPFQNPASVLRNQPTSSKQPDPPQIRQNNSPPVSSRPAQDSRRPINEWPQCQACMEAHLSCDGERPCSECSVYSIDCTYENDPPVPPQTSRHSGEKASARVSESVSDTADNEEPDSGAFVSIFAEIESEEDSDIDDDDDQTAGNNVLVDIKAIENLLHEFQGKMQDFQEYTLKPLLQQSRSDSKSREISTVPQPERSPFEAVSRDLRSSTDPCAKVFLSVKDYSLNAPATKQKWTSITSPMLRFQPDATSLPRYKSIGRMQASMLAKNVTIGKYNHYLAEDENYSWAAQQEKYLEVKERYHTYETISTSLHAQRDCAELVDRWRPWVEEFIRRAGIEPVDIIEYYTRDRESPDLDNVGLKEAQLAMWVAEQSKGCLLCRMENDWDETFPWSEISSSLACLRQGAGDAAALASAGLISTAFHENVGFSMWHVASTVPAIKQVLDKTRLENEETARADRMCLVCALHNCSLHGAYLEDPDMPVEHLEHDLDKIKINDDETNRNEHTMVALPEQSADDTMKGTPKQARRRKITVKSKKHRNDLGKHILPEAREVFIPCSHTGPCQDNPACSCFKAKIACEHYCGCQASCQRRWKGCNCAAGPNRVCSNDARCECWNGSRECDPWLCKSCGVLEVLDQANKYDEDIRKGRCCNNRLQLGIPARTIKAPSEVQGYGLFAGENIEEGDFIGEYKGEIISQPESDRRGAMYHLLGSEYLFILNATQQVDATNFGNKTRFMNNSNLEANINVAGCLMLCSGVHRIMLYAKKKIKAGEELLYNYDYPEEVSKHFWERGQVESSKTAAIEGTVSKMATGAKKQRARKRQSGNASLPESEDEVPESSQSPVVRQSVKRKFADIDAMQVDGSEDSEFSAEVDSSDSSDTGEDSVVSSADASGSAAPARLNRYGKPDGRVGGAAQRKGAKTRAKRLAKQQ